MIFVLCYIEWRRCFQDIEEMIMTQPNSLADSQGPGRDPWLQWFVYGGRYDRAVPAAGMAAALEAVTDPGGRPPSDASDDEVAGILGCWQALEAHAHARMLAAVREIIRRRAAEDGIPAAYPGELPARWGIGVAHEVAAQLRVSWQAAAPLVQLAWELEARLPRIGALLDAGVLTSLKVKIITDEFSVLGDDKISEAEKLLLEEDLAGDEMTPGRLRKLCQRIVDTVDPDGARERREQATRDRARVSFYQAHGGDAAMFAEGLPPDEALKCQANIQARAQDFRRTMVYPEAGMDLLRVLAMVDLINGTGLEERIARYHGEHAAAEDARNAARRAADQEAAETLARYRDLAAGAGGGSGNGGGRGSGGRSGDASGSGGRNGDGGAGDGGPEFGWPDDEEDPETARYGDDPDGPAPPVPDEEPGDLGDDCDFWPGFGPESAAAPVPAGLPSPSSPPGPPSPSPPGPPGGNGSRRGPGGTGPGGTGSGGVPAGAPGRGLPALAHLTLPLATLLHLAEKPGEAPGYGSIDPALVRDLARAAAASARTRFCLTVTDEHGHAAGHACARLIRDAGRDTGTRRHVTGPPGGSRDGPGDGWDLTPDHTRHGPHGGYGSWILSVPGGRSYRLDLHPVPTHGCDHRFATGSYRPGALLRHLVEVRDGECTFTGCSHPAARCDFEHAVPYDKGGKTDACNAGARSRRCHRVKQLKGWSVTQPKPGWHQWTTPSGRSYLKGPKSYPA
jgi:hypothetical protein